MTNHEINQLVYDYIKEYGEYSKIINKDEEQASKVFAGAIQYATEIFVNSLFLGGAYMHTEDFEEIRQHLASIVNILNQKL